MWGAGFLGVVGKSEFRDGYSGLPERSGKIALQPPAVWLKTHTALQAGREQGREPRTTASRKLANEMSRIKYYSKSLGEIHWS